MSRHRLRRSMAPRFFAWVAITVGALFAGVGLYHVAFEVRTEKIVHVYMAGRTAGLEECKEHCLETFVPLLDECTRRLQGRRQELPFRRH